MVYFHEDNTIMSLNASATVAYPLHNVLPNCSRKYCQYLVDYSHIYVVSLPVYTTK